MKNRRYIPLVGVVLATLAVGACQRSYTDDLAMDEAAVLRRGWLAGRQINEQAVYCYRTLSSPECYAEPEDGSNARMIGHFGNAPEDR